MEKDQQGPGAYRRWSDRKPKARSVFQVVHEQVKRPVKVKTEKDHPKRQKKDKKKVKKIKKSKPNNSYVYDDLCRIFGVQSVDEIPALLAKKPATLEAIKLEERNQCVAKPGPAPKPKQERQKGKKTAGIAVKKSSAAVRATYARSQADSVDDKPGPAPKRKGKKRKKTSKGIAIKKKRTAGKVITDQGSREPQSPFCHGYLWRVIPNRRRFIGVTLQKIFLYSLQCE